ncbi:major facilitator superfamily domain-containing protein [Cercophora newfieldiana]|uniref:Major facilitator superfamily domain-containing protein n=1 Tax=Cercophora newfieldiana TaxID=92897 RepID=A0AA39YMT0_9PEZI|nr:major facilitator superfamily domain-containing protein [Cercophora newfieldiana]
MVHTNLAASAVAASASTSSTAAVTRPRRFPSSGSFHAGAPSPFGHLSPYDEIPPVGKRRRKSTAASLRPQRRQSTHHYHTFPTPPPKTPSEQQHNTPDAWFTRPAEQPESSSSEDRGVTSYFTRRRRRRSSAHSDHSASSHDTTPLPWKQLGLLALLSLAEQTALNSISPYLPTMVASFPEIPPTQVGLYVGLLASAFAMAQLATNLFWGYLSDRVGRKPVMLLGTALLMVCFVFFGFCRNYAQLILVHIAMGLLNGNAAVVPTCLGELTDLTNQSRAFTWLPVMYSLGSITGPALGGLLVGTVAGDKYPFLAPNILGASLLLSAVVVLGIWFEETLDNAERKAAGAGLAWAEKLCRPCLGCCGKRKAKERRGSGWSARWPTSGQSAPRGQDGADGDTSDDGSADERQMLLPQDEEASGRHADDGKTAEQKSAFRQLANRTTLTLLITYLIFQLANISFGSLYPIFASAPPPTGRGLGPGTIGISLSLAGLATIAFQLTLFQPLKARMGNLGTYRYSLLGFVVSMALMPWIGYMDEDDTWLGIGSGKSWLYGELGFILIIRNICAVGGLSSVMLLINNSAPSHETLGTLNGIAQSLSAAGRSVGPFLSGGLFTLSTRVEPKGEVLAWGLFAGISLMGWVGTLMIRGRGLESADWKGDNGHFGDDESAAADSEEGGEGR